MRLIWAERRSHHVRPPGACLVCLAVCLVVSVVLSSCVGCRKKDDRTEAEKEAERLAKEREEKKPDFEIEPPISQPDDRKQSGCRYKPGHWISSVLGAKANKEDFVGDLEISLYQGKESKPLGLDAVAYQMTNWREAALAKGLRKGLHGSFFVPSVAGEVSSRWQLTARDTGHRRAERSFPLVRMLAYQYHFAVLTRSPERYAFLRLLDSIKPAQGEFGSLQQDYHYWVSLLAVDQQMPLPAHSLFWTSIAYVLWDGEPGSLSADQQRALVDWLHWGGQLLVSGPDTLDTIGESLLADYLPAEATGSWELQTKDFDEINRRFTLSGQRPLVPKGAWSGIRLRPTSGARFIPGTGKLLAERRVGRGRIVVSAMRLSDRTLINWPGFDNFFNACLLRRPARRYQWNEYEEVELRWANPALSSVDAALISKLRYFSRDVGVEPAEYTYCDGASKTASQGPRDADGPGVAAWRSFSPVANLAREALQTAACVEVPDHWFVIGVVAAYLAVLVPLNWFIFSALGRTEWAWAAAPVIAVAFTVAVVHLARLDIGFARSETELGVLEIQGEYARAHLTCYTALYTSLTTRYEFCGEDPGTLIQPFPTVGRREEFDLLPGQKLAKLQCRYGKEVRLRGFSIPSNTVDFIHAEQMVEMDGPLQIHHDSQGRQRLLNRTGIPLHGVGVIRKDETGKIQTAWIGELEMADNTELTFVRSEQTEGPWWPNERDAETATKSKAGKGEMTLRGLIDLAENVDDLRPGESRLVGWTGQAIGGLKITPAAPQSRRAVLVVAHVRRVLDGPPEADKNTKKQVEQSPKPSPNHQPPMR